MKTIIIYSDSKELLYDELKSNIDINNKYTILKINNPISNINIKDEEVIIYTSNVNNEMYKLLEYLSSIQLLNLKIICKKEDTLYSSVIYEFL